MAEIEHSNKTAIKKLMGRDRETHAKREMWVYTYERSTIVLVVIFNKNGSAMAEIVLTHDELNALKELME